MTDANISCKEESLSSFAQVLMSVHIPSSGVGALISVGCKDPIFSGSPGEARVSFLTYVWQ